MKHGTDLHVVVLAAGQGTRMKSDLPKVLHVASGRPLIGHVLRTAQALSPITTTVVIGHKAESIRRELASSHGHVQFAVQERQLGTAHAVRQVEPLLDGLGGTVVLLSGDVPLLTAATLGKLLAAHRRKKAAATVLTAIVDRPTGYGRIVRSGGRITRIVEERDASPAQRRIREINSGIYAFDSGRLFGALRAVAASSTSGEFYLTDVIWVLRKQRQTVGTITVEDPGEVRGVNTRRELAEVAETLRQRKNGALMEAGVTLVDPSRTYIDDDVQIGVDTVIHPGVVIQGATVIGAACEIQAYTRIVDSVLADMVTVLNFCVLSGARIEDRATVGPFAHLRPATILGKGSKVGNFVELKKTSLGDGSKASHLSYLGDASIGAHVNVGAGTITCNYDGLTKHQTVIEDNAFVGSDTQLIAPVRVGRGAYIGAGSSITKDVPPGALGIARGRQENIADWATQRAKRPKA